MIDFLTLIFDELGRYMESGMISHINWDNYWMSQNISAYNNIERWNGEIARLEYNEDLDNEPNSRGYLVIQI